MAPVPGNKRNPPEPRTDFQAFITIKARKKHPAVHIDNHTHMKTATGKFCEVRITEARVRKVITSPTIK
jgi:hypothetical protein